MPTIPFPAGNPLRLFALILLPVLLRTIPVQAARDTGPWSEELWRQAPQATWGERRGLVQEVYYESEPYQGHPTRVFAYFARPDSPTGPLPAVLLVHGGGGKAFSAWVEHWAQRGYAALAMDLSGVGPQGRLPDGGPDQNDDVKFRAFRDDEVKEMWTYHAVAAALRGHGLLASRPEIDAHRIGVTGISWGGYLTCIIAGVDAGLKVAVPVYGCGFLHEDSVWRESRFDRVPPEQARRWVAWFDPSRYLPGVSCPILFLNGSNDFAYPLDSHRHSFELVPGDKTLSVQIDLPHGHIWTFKEVDVFIDSTLRGGTPLARVKPLRLTREGVEVRFTSPVPITQATLHYTLDTGPWQKRTWHHVPALLKGRQATAPLPVARPLAALVTFTDARGLTVSTPHIDLSE